MASKDNMGDTSNVIVYNSNQRNTMQCYSLLLSHLLFECIPFNKIRVRATVDGSLNSPPVELTVVYPTIYEV